MKLNVKLMPAFMTVLSALYFIYVLSGGDTTLSADAVGGDPGGKVLPLAMAVGPVCAVNQAYRLHPPLVRAAVLPGIYLYDH